MEQPYFEALPTGGWTAADVARTEPDLVGEITDLFDALDYEALFNTVLDHRQVDLPVAIRALDDVLGEIPVPHTDEDDA